MSEARAGSIDGGNRRDHGPRDEDTMPGEEYIRAMVEHGTREEQSPSRGFAHLGAQFCADHQRWHMPEEKCHECNPPPPRTPEELANDPVLAALRRAPPMSPEMAAECRALMAEVVEDRPTFSMGVMDAIIARRKKLAKDIAKNPTPLRQRAVAALEGDRDLCDLLTAAADAIGDLRRERTRLAGLAAAWEEFSDALHKDDADRLKAAGEAIAKHRKPA